MSRPPAGAPWPTASTRMVVLLGWPGRYSLSPVLHNAAFVEQDLDLVYLVLPTRPDDLSTVVSALAATGAVGANVTVPHKRAVMAECDRLTPEAELVGAVNTLAWGSDGLLGDNTDAAGLRDAVQAEVRLTGGDATVVLGTGGAARAAAVALGRVGCEMTIVGRRPDAAEEIALLAVRAGARWASGLDVAEEHDLRTALADARLVINATPLGMDGERLPEPFHELSAGQVAYDLVYQPPETPFLRSAHERGVAAHHGLGMLVAQAAAAYRRWTGREAPVATMSAAALGALASSEPLSGRRDR